MVHWGLTLSSQAGWIGKVVFRTITHPQFPDLVCPLHLHLPSAQAICIRMSDLRKWQRFCADGRDGDGYGK